MSQADVQAVRDLFAAFLDRDLDRFLGFIHPDVEFRSLVLEVEGVFLGHQGARSWWESVIEVFPDWTPTVEETRDLGNAVLLRVRAEGSGTGIGSAKSRDIWQVATVSDGLVTSWTFLRTEQEALEAAARITPAG